MATERDAATVALLRDEPRGKRGDAGLQVLLGLRPATSRFAASAEVFPGGSLERQDLEPQGRAGAGRAGPNPVGREFLRAAVRETFEECGVLLARDRSGRRCGASELASFRSARLPTSAPFGERLRRSGLRPAFEDLVYCARWVTPEGFPVVYDTRFFVAGLPRGQEARVAAAGELEALRWLEPEAALALAERGETLILPPTRALLRRLCGLPTVRAALGSLGRDPVERIRPQLSELTPARYPGLDLRRLGHAEGRGT